MFWGLILEPNKRYSQTVKKPFHISMAAQDGGSLNEKPSQVICSYEGRNHLLCTLQYPNVMQYSLDLNFAAGTEITLATNGEAHVHLTGYIFEEEEDTFSQLGEVEESEEESDEKRVSKKMKKRRLSESSTEVLEKRGNLLNGSANEELDEEEESDDPDFEETEEEENNAEEEEDEEDKEDSDEEVVEEETDEDDKEDTDEDVVVKEERQPKQSLEQKKFSKPQKNTLKLGVVTEDLVEGNGPKAKLGRFVTVYYEGRLQKNNKVFDSSKKGPGFKFRLGGGEVIKGWDLGIVGMKVGGTRKIICPPQAAYGAKGSLPAIPPNATLVFTVTLNKIK